MASALGTVILFARTPRLGRGKRRLAREIGDLGALQFYRRALAKSARLVASEQGWHGVLALDPPISVDRPGPPFAWGRTSRLTRVPQTRRDLGRRMLSALSDAPPGPVVLIGADIPGVTARALRRALLACRRADFVFGPATDGGFWLIGAKRRPSPRLFREVGWSRSTTLDEAVAALPRPARVALVDRLNDVDNAADLSAQT